MAVTVADLGARVLRRLGIAAVAAADRPALTVTVSVAEIALRALQWLGVVAADETPIAADAAIAQAKVQAVHDSLVGQGIVSWPSSAIPQAVSEDYVMLVALHLASTFGKPGDAAQEPAREAHIRRVSLLMQAPGIAEQAVMDVHANLDARGKARWSVFDIPDYAEAPYVMLAANLAAPAFGLPVDPAADVRAMRDLAQVVSLRSSGAHVRAEYF